MYENATVGPIRNYLIDLDVTKALIVTGAAMGGTASISVTLPASFTNVDSFRAFAAPGGSGSGNTIDPNLVVVRTAVNKVTIKTANGAVSSSIMDVIAFGS